MHFYENNLLLLAVIKVETVHKVREHKTMYLNQLQLVKKQNKTIYHWEKWFLHQVGLISSHIV